MGLPGGSVSLTLCPCQPSSGVPTLGEPHTILGVQGIPENSCDDASNVNCPYQRHSSKGTVVSVSSPSTTTTPPPPAHLSEAP